MPKEILPNEVHPDDREYFTRRETLMKGLRIAENVGWAAAGGSVGFFAVKGAMIEAEVATDYPAETGDKRIVAQAQKILHEHSVLGNQSQDRVEWAQNLISQREARSKDHDSRLGDFAGSWWKIAKYPVIGGGATTLLTSIAKDVVRHGTKKELSRRELLRFKK